MVTTDLTARVWHLQRLFGRIRVERDEFLALLANVLQRVREIEDDEPEGDDLLHVRARVLGCPMSGGGNWPVEGAAIHYYGADGTHRGDATTDADGYAHLYYMAGDSMRITKALYATHTGTVSASTTLSPASGYLCCDGGEEPVEDQSPCVQMPATVEATVEFFNGATWDAIGSATLNWDAGLSLWTETIDADHASWTIIDPDCATTGPPFCFYVAGGATALNIQFLCSGASRRVRLVAPVCEVTDGPGGVGGFRGIDAATFGLPPYSPEVLGSCGVLLEISGSTSSGLSAANTAGLCDPIDETFAVTLLGLSFRVRIEAS